MKHLQYCKKLKTVVLKEGVKKLGEYVFTRIARN